MVTLIEVKIHFVTIQVHFDNINVKNIAKLKLAHVRGLQFVLFDDTKAEHLGLTEEGC